jgi:hypothetical protein
MQLLNTQATLAIAGGVKNYNANLNTDVPLSMMPYIATQFESAKVGTQFSELVATLTNAGFDVNQVRINIGISAYEYDNTNTYLLAK